LQSHIYPFYYYGDYVFGARKKPLQGGGRGKSEIIYRELERLFSNP